MRPSGLCLLDKAVTGRWGRGSSSSGKNVFKKITQQRFVWTYLKRCTKLTQGTRFCLLLTTFCRRLCRFRSSFLRCNLGLEAGLCHCSKGKMSLGQSHGFFMNFLISQANKSGIRLYMLQPLQTKFASSSRSHSSKKTGKRYCKMQWLTGFCSRRFWIWFYSGVKRPMWKGLRLGCTHQGAPWGDMAKCQQASGQCIRHEMLAAAYPRSRFVELAAGHRGQHSSHLWHRFPARVSSE